MDIFYEQISTNSIQFIVFFLLKYAIKLNSVQSKELLKFKLKKIN